MNLTRKLIAEFFAIALFTFVILSSGNDPYLVGCGYWMVIQGTGFIKPFHLNPLVQIGSIIHKRTTHFLTQKDKLYLLWSILVQIIGSIVGALFSLWIYDSEFYFKPNTSDFETSQFFFAEAIYSINIIIVSLSVGQWSDNKLIGLFAISSGITGGIVVVGKMSGACFNPTTCFVINILHAIKSNSPESVEYLWLYFFAPLIGASVGTGLAIILHPKPEEKKHIRHATDAQHSSDPNSPGTSNKIKSHEEKPLD